MSLLPQYKNLDEKGRFFDRGYQTIETKAAFDYFWKRLRDLYEQQVYGFRGCAEAKYKLYNSAQRFWIERQLSRQKILYPDFIKRMIDQTSKWNGKTISRFFAQNGIDQHHALAYLSFMQHYGMPTPLIDFTLNPFIALYFAFENPRFYSSDQEIDQFASLYIINTANTYFIDVIQQFDNSPDVQSAAIDYDKSLAAASLIFISTKNQAYRILNNVNILNQEGVFFFNSDPYQPLEEVYHQHLTDIKRSLGNPIFKAKNYRERLAECVNIHRGLRPYVLNKLQQENITKDYIFPDLIQLTERALQQALLDVKPPDRRRRKK